MFETAQESLPVRTLKAAIGKCESDNARFWINIQAHAERRLPPLGWSTFQGATTIAIAIDHVGLLGIRGRSLCLLDNLGCTHISSSS